MPSIVTQVNVLDAIGNELTIYTALPPGSALSANSNPVVLPLDQTPIPIKGLALGGNQIGNVSITTMPGLPAGSNLLGSFSLSALPGLTSGSNNIGVVTTTADASIGAGVAPSKALIVGGIYNTLIPSPSAGQTLALQVDSAGRLLTNTEISFTGIGTGSNQIGNVSVTAITLPGLSSGANSLGSVNAVGSAISNAVPSGGPVQVGGIYNATQPTINSTCMAPLQTTTRGGLIVSTGADNFNVTINAGLPTGGNLLGNVSVSSITLPGLSVSLNAIGLVNSNADAAIGVGTAPAKSLIVGAVYNSSPPAPSSGQSMALQADSGGKLLVNAAVTLGGLSPSSNNIGIVNTYADALIGVGTAPLKAFVIAGQYNTVLPSPTAAQTVGLQVDAAGRLITNTSISIDGIGLATGANVIGLVNTNSDAAIAPGTAPAKALITGGVYNSSPPAPTTGQSLALQLDSAGKLYVNAAVSISGLAAGANLIGVVNCSGMAGSNVAFSGNPVWTAGVYNATQPTINSLCIAPFQMTTRGGLIVSTGTDIFNTTISAGLPTGANLIGNVSVSSITLPGLTSGSNNIGIVTCVLPGLSTGTNSIGNVSVTSITLPGLSTGTNSIGNVSVTSMTLPGLSTGANLIGSVSQSGVWTTGFLRNSIEMVPTVNNTVSYSAGWVIGGIITFANILPASLTATLETIILKFKASVQTTEFDVGIFTSSPVGSFSDHGSPSIDTTDTARLLGIYRLIAVQSCFGTHSIYTLSGIDTELSGATQSLFAVVITKSIPTNPATTSDMSLRIGVIS